MIQILFNVFISILEVVVGILVEPLMNAINQYMPEIGNGLSMVSNFFNHIGQYNSFVLSYTGLNANIITILVAMFIGIIIIPINVHIFKMVAKWWETLV